MRALEILQALKGVIEEVLRLLKVECTHLREHEIVDQVQLCGHLEKHLLVEQSGVDALIGLRPFLQRDFLPKERRQLIAQEETPAFLLAGRSPGPGLHDSLRQACKAGSVPEAHKQPVVASEPFGGVQELAMFEGKGNQFRDDRAFFLVVLNALL